MIRKILIGFALLPILILLFCVKKSEIEILPDNRYAETVVVAADIDYDPFSFFNKYGEPSGYDVELLYAIANKMRVNINVKLMDWGDCKTAAANGEAQMITGNPYNHGGYESLIQSRALTNDPFVSIGRENFKNVIDLNNKKLATIEKCGCTLDFLEPYQFVENTKYYTSYTDAVLSVISGENDYAIVRHSVGKRILAKLKNSDVGVAGPVLANSLLCIGVNEHYPELAQKLNIAIAELQKDGTINKLTDKWLGNYVELISLGDFLRLYSERVFIAALCFVVLAAAAVLYAYRRRMRMIHIEQEKRIREQELALQGQAFEMMNENFLGGIFGVYLTERYPLYFANDAFIEMMGYERAEYEEKFRDDTIRMFHPEDLEYMRRVSGHGAETSGGSFSGRARWLKKGDAPIWVEFRARKTKDRSGRDIFLIIAIDITDLTDKVNRDALTGLYNRHYMDDKIRSVINVMSRSNGGYLSVLMIDVDYFKRYNDAYGHVAGDECLKAVAGALKQCVTREEDFVARYGGEEFAVILPNTDDDGTGLIAERMLNKVRECNIPHEKSDVADIVTISIGGTTCAVKHSQSEVDLIRHADEALYQSKWAGRNRYTFKIQG